MARARVRALMQTAAARFSFEQLAGIIRDRDDQALTSRVVGVDGLSGAGKSGFARRLAAELGAPCLCTDEFVPGWDGLADSVGLLIDCVLRPQTLLTLVIALPLALGYGPATAFQLLATILTAVMLGIYIVINISSIGFYVRKQRDEFNWFLHLVLPIAGALVLLPVLAAAVGVGSSVLKFVSPLPYPISEAGLAVGLWFIVGVGYLIYLLLTHPDRIRQMDKVFD